MGTSTKVDATAKEAARMRRNLLRNPPRKVSAEARAVLAELALIHKSPRLSGKTKHELFVRGAKQLEELK